MLVALRAQALGNGLLSSVNFCKERHYRLVPAKKLNQEAIRDYRD